MLPIALITQLNSAFTLATLEPGLVPFLRADISRLTGICQVPIVLLISKIELNQS